MEEERLSFGKATTPATKKRRRDETPPVIKKTRTEREYETRTKMWDKRIKDALTKRTSAIYNPSSCILAYNSKPANAFLHPDPVMYQFIPKLVCHIFQDNRKIDIAATSNKPSPDQVRINIQNLSQDDKDCIDNAWDVMQQSKVDNKRLAARNRVLDKFHLPRTPFPVPTDQHHLPQADEMQDHPDCRITNMSIRERTIMAVHYALEKHITRKEAASIMEIPVHRVYAAMTALRSGVFIQKFTPRPPAENKRNKQYGDRLDCFIRSQIQLYSGCITPKDLKSLYMLNHPMLRIPTVKTFYNRLRQLNYTHKRSIYCPEERNSLANKEYRYWYMIQFIKALWNDRKIVSIDETAFNYQQSMFFHYAPKGQVISYHRTSQRTKNVSCLLAVNQDGLEQSLFIDGACDATIFFHFITVLVESDVKYSEPNRRKRPLLIFDNVPFHHVKELHYYLAHHEVDVLFTPSYSPMMNPVEFMNQRIKHHLQDAVLKPR